MIINFLSNKVPWFGKYSGYECLTNYLPKELSFSIYTSNPTFFNRLVGKFYQLRNGWTSASPAEIQGGMKFLHQMNRSNVSHVLYLEPHIHLLNYLNNSKSLLATVHLPISQWKEKNLLLLSKLNNIIILYEEEVEKFSKYLPKSKIHVIKHGVDIDFFKPDASVSVQKNKILFVGHYLRNFDMLLKVYNTITNEISDSIEFHFVIPSAFRYSNSALKSLLQKSNVFFHENLSDEELVEQYQTSNVLLMPMEDSGANTAMVQAIAIGLPIITTDVGGIRTYGGNEIFPIVSNNDCAGMVNLFKRYYDNQGYRDDISHKMREYAIDKLDWNIIVKQHMLIYDEINQA